MSDRNGLCPKCEEAMDMAYSCPNGCERSELADTDGSTKSMDLEEVILWAEMILRNEGTEAQAGKRELYVAYKIREAIDDIKAFRQFVE